MAKLSLTDITTGYASAAAYNANNALIEAALENTLSRDGTAPNTMSAALDMNSNKINNLTDGTNNQDAVTLAQLNAVIAGTGGLANIVEDLTPQLGATLDSNDFGINYSSASYLYTVQTDETNGWFEIAADTPFTNEWGVNLDVGGWFSMQSGGDVYTTLETTPILGDTLYNQILWNSTNGTGYLAEASFNGDSFFQIGSYVQDAPMGLYVTQGSSTGYKYAQVFDAENGYTYFGQFPVRIGNAGNTWENQAPPYDLNAPITYPTDYVEHEHDGTSFNVTGVNTANYNLTGMNTVQLTAGVDLRIFGPGDIAYVGFSHDDTDLLINGSATTDINITGISAIQAGSTSADFNALTATTIGGITEANLVDKAANEVVTGHWNVPATMNEQNGNYTTVLGDAGKVITKVSGGAGETITIDSNANVAYPIGTCLGFNNDGGGTLSIAITTDTLTFADDNTTGTRTLADGGFAVAIKTDTTAWKIAGGGIT